MLLQIFGVITTMFILLIVFFKRRYSYWRDRGVAYIEPIVPYGNFKDNLTEKISFGDWLAEFYSTMKARKVQHAGCFFVASPIYVPIDLDLIKRIMTADFTHFTDHRIYVNDEDDPLSAHLFALSGRRWRDLRVKLTPTYTSGRMKLMFPVMVALSHELIATLKEEHQKGPVDITNICTRFSTDIVGNCTLGIDCNSLKDPYSEFCVKGKRLFNVTRLEMKFLRSRFLPKEATDFFWKVTKDATDYRENTKVRRDDVLQLLIDLMHKEDEENGTSLTFNELAAQVLIFFVAGFATSSILMYFALFELSLNEDIQDQLRRETLSFA